MRHKWKLCCHSDASSLTSIIRGGQGGSGLNGGQDEGSKIELIRACEEEVRGDTIKEGGHPPGKMPGMGINSFGTSHSEIKTFKANNILSWLMWSVFHRDRFKEVQSPLNKKAMLSPCEGAKDTRRQLS
ncbi:hypothetical protein H5410_037674 [Solanum commersonii]|uniref:Uncharacterized protein n=1 Tax=Solanum commersonii TaxID=4109 RepID=A0A9J5Y8M6_SOLCO|nr:hypothetical protein H5410_037674 [Solanum commersonii]